MGGCQSRSRRPRGVVVGWGVAGRPGGGGRAGGWCARPGLWRRRRRCRGRGRGAIRSGSCQPRARAWSTVVTSAGHQVLACIAWLRVPRAAGEGSVPGGGQGGVGVELVRPRRGSGVGDPPPQRGRGVVVGQRPPAAVRSRAAASIPARVIAARRSASRGEGVVVAAGTWPARVAPTRPGRGSGRRPAVEAALVRCRRRGGWGAGGARSAGVPVAARHTATSASTSWPGAAVAARPPGGARGCAAADLVGEVGDQLGAGGQVGAPVGSVGQGGGDGRAARAADRGRCCAARCRPGASRARRRGRRRCRAPARWPPSGRTLDGVGAGGGDEQQVGPQRRPRRGVADHAGHQPARRPSSSAGGRGGADVLSAARWRASTYRAVACPEPAAGSAARAQGGGRGRCVVAGQDGLEQVGGGARVAVLGADDLCWSPSPTTWR